MRIISMDRVWNLFSIVKCLLGFINNCFKLLIGENVDKKLFILIIFYFYCRLWYVLDLVNDLEYGLEVDLIVRFLFWFGVCYIGRFYFSKCLLFKGI